jgi:hypothetical protein
VRCRGWRRVRLRGGTDLELEFLMPWAIRILAALGALIQLRDLLRLPWGLL